MLAVKLNKIRLHHSRPDAIETVNDEVIDEHLDMLVFDSCEDSEKLSKLAGYNLRL